MKLTRRALFQSVFAAAAAPYLPKPMARGVSLAAVRAFDRQALRSNLKIGDTILIRKPVRFIARAGQPFQPEGYHFEFDRILYPS